MTHKKYIPVFMVVLAFFNLKIEAQNLNLSNSVLFDGEPYIAVNPQNQNNMVVAWMGFGGGNTTITIKTKASFDGGATWGYLNYLPHLGKTYQSADVSMAFDRTGKLYLAYIDHHENPDSGGVYITTSITGAITWTTPIKIWDINETSKLALDRPWLVVDNSGTSTDRRLYLTTKPAPWIPAPNRPYLKYSSDGGHTWSPYQFLDTTGYLVGNIIQAPMATPSVSADGTFYVIYPSYLASQSPYARYILEKSTDGGKTFKQYVAIEGSQTVKDTGLKQGYRLATNPKDKNQLAFAFIDGSKGDPDVFVITSADGGQTWSSRTRVNDDAIGNGKDQDLPWVSYNDAGALTLTWRDRRNSPGTGSNQPFDIYGAISTDNGNTFSPNIRLTDSSTPFASLLYNPGNDFMCSFTKNDSINAVWGDLRTGKLNIFYSKTAVKTGHTTSVEVSHEYLPGMEIYPNPANAAINLKYYNIEGESIDVEISDITGKELIKIANHKSSSGWNEMSIVIRHLGSGTYICSIIQDGQRQSLSFIVK